MPINSVSKKECTGCSACFNICPVGCIDMQVDKEGFYYPRIDKKQCIDCKKCDNVCACIIDQENRAFIPKTFAARAREDSIRMKGSSGGMFPVLAETLLNSGGVVYGVKMSKNCRTAQYYRVDSKKDLVDICGSKYVEAQSGKIFNSVKKDLGKNRKVLFSGTPCQINGLKFYLGKEYHNLICVEVICHGVPSPLLWNKYIEYLEKKNKTTINSINFRGKEKSWKNFEMQIYGDKIKQEKCHDEDSYMLLFLKNLCLRQSCYNCIAKKKKSNADITLGDFWGIGSVLPEMDDDKGTSLVLLQTELGQLVFREVEKKIEYKEVVFEEAILHNAAYYESVKEPLDRGCFFEDLANMGFRQLENKYLYVTPRLRLSHSIHESRYVQWLFNHLN